MYYVVALIFCLQVYFTIYSYITEEDIISYSSFFLNRSFAQLTVSLPLIAVLPPAH